MLAASRKVAENRADRERERERKRHKEVMAWDRRVSKREEREEERQRAKETLGLLQF